MCHKFEIIGNKVTPKFLNIVVKYILYGSWEVK